MVKYLRNTDDYLLPTSIYRPSTRKLNPVNRDFFKLKAREITGASAGSLSDPCIMFYLPDMREPIVLSNVAVIVLGRSDSTKPTNANLTIDLADHHGALLGVSRVHAKIVYRDGEYYVSDLNSTNGTWVNNIYVEDNEEVLLSNGDSLRLGHVVMQIGGYGRTH